MNRLISRVLAFGLPLVAILGLPAPVGAAAGLQITNVAWTAEGLRLDWTDLGPGMAYTVQRRDTFAGGLWVLPWGETPWPIAGPSWTEREPADSPTRFYRVLAVPAAERGKLLSPPTLEQTMTAAEIEQFFSLVGVELTAVYDVQVYKVVYETIAPWGGRTRASGALALPLGTGQPLPLVSYQHGTITETNGAPSSMGYEVVIGVAFATSGYAGAVPDYLGLGDSPGYHPYQHARSEATACVDFLRAVRTFCATNGFPLTNRLFLCGYSQGGHATMALHRELETYHTNEFDITASAPMAGAYDMSGVTADDILSGRPMPNPYYLAYLLAAYQDVYRLAPTLADLLAPPYNTTLPPLLQGNTSGGDINAAMPTNALQILRPEYLEAFRNDPGHPLRLALRDNDVYRWTPRAPMRLYHCDGDADVIVLNSWVAVASFHDRGATQVEWIDPMPGADHGDCVYPSLEDAKAWFDSLR